MHSPPSEDSQLVLKCLAGDAGAFELLVSRYQNAAYATALNFLRNRSDAQDIVQEAFIAAYCKLGQLRDPALFGSWLRRIVVTRCKELLRRRQLLQNHIYLLEAVERDLERAAEVEHVDRTRKMDIWDAVDRLPEHYRIVALMHYLSGLSYEEIATFMDVPVSTIKGRLQQSRIRLREALLKPEKEEIEMNKIEVTKEVQDVICQIATEQVREVIPLRDTEYIVLYCGVDVDIEVREADGDDVLLEGTKAAVGFSKEAAQASVERIEVLADQVENFLEAGPHEGEIFVGTDSTGGNLVGISRSAESLWKRYIQGQGIWNWTSKDVKLVDLYPFLKGCRDMLPEEVQGVLKHATRISILRKKMEDIILSRQAYTPDVQKVFRPNNTSQDRVHGPIGYVSMTLFVPASKTVTIIRGKNVRVCGLRASVNLIESYGAEVSDVLGDVYLFDSAFKTAQRIKGKFCQKFYQYGGADGSDYKIRRSGQQDCILEDVDGEIDIDVGRTNIEAVNLSGHVRISNRYGTTRLYQNRFNSGSRFCIESCSGEILLFLKEDLIDQVNLTVNTLCGTIKYDPLKVLGGIRMMNDLYMMLISTITSSQEDRRLDVLDADFHVKTESGDVTIEKMK